MIYSRTSVLLYEGTTAIFAYILLSLLRYRYLQAFMLEFRIYWFLFQLQWEGIEPSIERPGPIGVVVSHH